MNEDAQEIFDYLPIRRNTPENEYIDHLWNAFIALDVNETTARPFVMMPFHLLFMLSVQYKIIRISKEKRIEYLLALTMVDKKEDLKSIFTNPSVFDFGLLGESKLIDLLKLIEVTENNIKKIKSLIKDRNNKFAHAKGGIEPEPEKRIAEYLQALKNIQEKMKPLNKTLVNEWQKEITEEDDPNDFVESKLLNTFLCPADFNNSEEISFRQIQLSNV